MRVQDVMTREVVCCTPDESLQSVAQKMVETDCGAIPVVESESTRRVIGIITDRDLVCRAIAMGMNPLELSARDGMTEPCTTISPEADLSECCDIMERLQIRRVPVVDETGNCCGIVAQADIAQRAGEHETAEVVREISQPVA